MGAGEGPPGAAEPVDIGVPVAGQLLARGHTGQLHVSGPVLAADGLVSLSVVILRRQRRGLLTLEFGDRLY